MIFARSFLLLLFIVAAQGNYEFFSLNLKCPQNSDRSFKQNTADLEECLGICTSTAGCQYASFRDSDALCIGCNVAPTEVHVDFTAFKKNDQAGSGYTESLIYDSDTFENDRASFNAEARQVEIIKRVCDSCIASAKVIYYHRKTDWPSFADPYGLFLEQWLVQGYLASNINDPNQWQVFHHDFDLYSSLTNLEADQNPWDQCNGNDPTIGFPRDCGPIGFQTHQWTSFVHPDSKTSYRYYALHPPVQGTPPAVCLSTLRRLELGWIRMEVPTNGADDSMDIVTARGLCASAGKRYTWIECAGEVWCGDVWEEQDVIPLGNCLGSPELSPTIGGGSNQHCVALGTFHDGTWKGGWHRGALYLMDECDDDTCGAHGTCADNGVCVCDADYYGPYCLQTSDTYSSEDVVECDSVSDCGVFKMRGVCNVDTNQCNCNYPWSGRDCAEKVSCT